MHFHNLKIAALALSAAASTAKVISVDVGEGGFTYNPDTITAAAGDSVEFHFYAQHSVVAADFAKPCQPASSGGFFSGILNNKASGMVGVINQGTDTLAAFKAAAEKTDTSSSPNAPFGGFNGPAPNSTSSSATTTSGSKTESATSTASASGTETHSPTSVASASETQAQSPTSSLPTAPTMTAAAAYLNGHAAAVGALAVAIAAMIGL
ncbi:hypothetical protein PCL_12087 [Purpureocillium lilacinum]|uniref:Extracellular serine-rich protein n=1 Tax=Purpureocillium lilacinum TaxID=33203 RepID=A0A2U3DPI5_PURLI|nr:hypothetical protein PCL_12087 [Purpureocillium lilacinum]